MKFRFIHKNLIILILVTLITLTSVYLSGCSYFAQNQSIDSKYKVANRWIEDYNEIVDDAKYIVGDRSYSKSDNYIYISTESFEYVLELDKNNDVLFFELSNGDVDNKIAVMKYCVKTLNDRELPEDVNTYFLYLHEKLNKYEELVSNNEDLQEELLTLNFHIMRVAPYTTFLKQETTVPRETTFEIIYN